MLDKNGLLFALLVIAAITVVVFSLIAMLVMTGGVQNNAAGTPIQASAEHANGNSGSPTVTMSHNGSSQSGVLHVDGRR
jgi:hypothetical protein